MKGRRLAKMRDSRNLDNFCWQNKFRCMNLAKNGAFFWQKSCKPENLTKNMRKIDEIIVQKVHFCPNRQIRREEKAKMIGTREKLEEILAILKENEKIANAEIEKCPEGKLTSEKRKQGTLIFCATKKTDGRKQRKCINKDTQMIHGLARREFLEKELDVLKSNIALVEGLLDEYRDTSTETILSLLPQRVQWLPMNFFLSERENKAMEKFRLWLEEPYEQSSYKAESKRHMTSRGLAVRSKSELAIAETLYKYDIPFRYEQVLHFGKYNVAPDFLPRNRRTGKQFYLEHCGMPGDERYMKNHKWKMDLYESVGIVPWDNLIVTYDDIEGNLDLKVVESELRSKLL